MSAIQTALAPIMAESSTYAGIVENPDSGTVTLYVTPGGVSAADAAITAAGDSAAVDVVAVPKSTQDLNALSNIIGSDYSQISNAGIDTQFWSTSVATNTINVVVSSPVAAAASYFNAQYGSGAVTVSSGTVIPVATRFADSPPFWDGDTIGCTSNFYYTGNNSGSIFGLTAGHCGTYNQFYQNNQYIGHTATNYLTNGIEDAQSYTCQNGFSTCGGGYVWYGPNSNQYYPVTGLCGGSCQTGALLTADGQENGGNQVTGNTITSTNAHFVENGYTLTGLDVAVNYSQNPPSVAGDSGGPVYQRQPNGSVLANGLIIAEITGTNPGMIYDPMSQVLSVVNGTLVTG